MQAQASFAVATEDLKKTVLGGGVGRCANDLKVLLDRAMKGNAAFLNDDLRMHIGFGEHMLRHRPSGNGCEHADAAAEHGAFVIDICFKRCVKNQLFLCASRDRKLEVPRDRDLGVDAISEGDERGVWAHRWWLQQRL